MRDNDGVLPAFGGTVGDQGSGFNVPGQGQGLIGIFLMVSAGTVVAAYFTAVFAAHLAGIAIAAGMLF